MLNSLFIGYVNLFIVYVSFFIVYVKYTNCTCMIKPVNKIAKFTINSPNFQLSSFILQSNLNLYDCESDG